MSLDVTILDDQDRVIRSVGFSVDEHWKLVEFARRRKLPLLKRLHDYYSDGEISARELPEFLEEVDVAIGSGELGARLGRLLALLADLIQFAISEDRSLVIIAD